MLQQSFLQPFNKNQIIVLRYSYTVNSIRVNLLLLSVTLVKNDLAKAILRFSIIIKRIYF